MNGLLGNRPETASVTGVRSGMLYAAKIKNQFWNAEGKVVWSNKGVFRLTFYILIAIP